MTNGSGWQIILHLPMMNTSLRFDPIEKIAANRSNYPKTSSKVARAGMICVTFSGNYCIANGFNMSVICSTTPTK